MASLNLPMTSNPLGSFAGEGAFQFPWDTVDKIDVHTRRNDSINTNFARRYWPMGSITEIDTLSFEHWLRPLDTSVDLSVLYAGFCNSADALNNKNMVAIYNYKPNTTNWQFGGYIFDDAGLADTNLGSIDYNTYKNQWLRITADLVGKVLTVKVYDDIGGLLATVVTTMTPGRTLTMDSYSLMNYYNIAAPKTDNYFNADLNRILASSPTTELTIKNVIIKNAVVRAI